jgi:uncharacterized membrane protein
MNVSPELFSVAWHLAALVVSLAALGWCVRTGPWAGMREGGMRLHVLLAFGVVLALMWSMKAGIHPGLNLHLLGAMAATLTLGPQLAMVALGIAVCAVSLNGGIAWQAIPINFALMAVWPVLVALGIQRLVERRLPKHFFVYVFVVAFLGSALTVGLQGLLASLAKVAAGAYSLEFIAANYLPFLMLLGFSEAWMSGMAMTLMVVYRPEWVTSFDDRSYLLDK